MSSIMVNAPSNPDLMRETWRLAQVKISPAWYDIGDLPPDVWHWLPRVNTDFGLPIVGYRGPEWNSTNAAYCRQFFNKDLGAAVIDNHAITGDIVVPPKGEPSRLPGDLRVVTTFGPPAGDVITTADWELGAQHRVFFNKSGLEIGQYGSFLFYIRLDVESVSRQGIAFAQDLAVKTLTVHGLRILNKIFTRTTTGGWTAPPSFDRDFDITNLDDGPVYDHTKHYHPLKWETLVQVELDGPLTTLDDYVIVGVEFELSSPWIHETEIKDPDDWPDKYTGLQCPLTLDYLPLSLTIGTFPTRSSG
jgi:hypothetical protein